MHRLYCKWFILTVFLATLVILPSFSTLFAQDTVTIIANDSVLQDKIDRETLKNVYLANLTNWENGDSIRVVMLKNGSVHEEFVRNVVGSTPQKFKNLWMQIVFTGAGRPPKIVKTEKEMLSYVAKTKGAIGYIRGGREVKDTKILTLE